MGKDRLVAVLARVVRVKMVVLVRVMYGRLCENG